MAKHPTRPRDFAKLATLVVDIATGQAPPDPSPALESPRAIVGRKGGLKGGKARAKAQKVDETKVALRELGLEDLLEGE